MELTSSQQPIYNAIGQAGSITRQGLVNVLDCPINRITGRVAELLDKGYVIEKGCVVVDGRTRGLLHINQEKR